MPVGFRVPRQYIDFDYKAFSVEAYKFVLYVTVANPISVVFSRVQIFESHMHT